MIKQIRTEQLLPGMYIHDLTCGWLDHPFMSNAFYVKDQATCDKIVNLGPGYDVPIRDLVAMICRVVGYKGGIRYDTSRPDGTPRKMVDASYAASLGWRAKTPLGTGLEETYRWYVDHVAAEGQRAVA